MERIDENSVIAFKMRKNPTLFKHFQTITENEENKGFSIAAILALVDKIKSNANLIKGKINLLEMDSFEDMEDGINDLLMNQKAKKLAHSSLSNKNKHLVNDEVLKVCLTAIDLGIEKENVKPYLAKIAAFKTPNDYINALKKCIDDFYVADIDQVITKINKEKINATVLLKDYQNKQLILKINDYDASRMLCPPAWCISYSYYFYGTYTSKRGSHGTQGGQFILFNFAKPVTDPKSVIGVTYAKNKFIFAADKRDHSLPVSNKYVNKVIKVAKSKVFSERELFKNKLKTITLNSWDDVNYIDFLLNKKHKKYQASETELSFLIELLISAKDKQVRSRFRKVLKKFLLRHIDTVSSFSKPLQESIINHDSGLAIFLAKKGAKIKNPLYIVK